MFKRITFQLKHCNALTETESGATSELQSFVCLVDTWILLGLNAAQLFFFFASLFILFEPSLAAQLQINIRRQQHQNYTICEIKFQRWLCRMRGFLNDMTKDIQSSIYLNIHITGLDERQLYVLELFIHPNVEHLSQLLKENDFICLFSGGGGVII